MLTHLCAEGLDVVLEGGVHALQGLHCVLVSPQLLGQLLVFVLDASEDLLGIMVELVQLIGRSQDLCPCVDELQQVGPRLVEPILPLGDGGRIRVPGVDEFVSHVIHRVYTLLADVAGIPGKFSEPFLQHLQEK